MRSICFSKQFPLDLKIIHKRMTSSFEINHFSILPLLVSLPHISVVRCSPFRDRFLLSLHVTLPLRCVNVYILYVSSIHNTGSAHKQLHLLFSDIDFNIRLHLVLKAQHEVCKTFHTKCW